MPFLIPLAYLLHTHKKNQEVKKVSIPGRIRKMLRTDRHEDQGDICREDCAQEPPPEAPPEGEDDPGDLHPPQPQAQAPRLLP